MNKNNIAIIGSGAFACAIYTALRDVKSNDISIFFKDMQCLEDTLLNNRKHTKMNCKFDDNTLLTSNFATALEGRDIIFLCCTFSASNKVIKQIKQIHRYEKKLKIIICCKGMLDNEPFFLYDEIREQLSNSTIFVLSGGSFADEVCEKKTTLVNLSCENKTEYNNISEIFDSSFLKLKYCNNPKAVEILGAIKNIMAIYAGYCSKDNSVNTIIKELVDFINDTRNVFLQLGFDDGLLFEPAGIGDIMLTCLSGKSRNKTFGELLAVNSQKANEYILSNTVEGYDAIFALRKFCLVKNIRFQFLDNLVDIVNFKKNS